MAAHTALSHTRIGQAGQALADFAVWLKPKFTARAVNNTVRAVALAVGIIAVAVLLAESPWWAVGVLFGGIGAEAFVIFWRLATDQDKSGEEK